MIFFFPSRRVAVDVCETVRGHFAKRTLTPQSPDGAFPTRGKPDGKSA